MLSIRLALRKRREKLPCSGQKSIVETPQRRCLIAARKGLSAIKKKLAKQGGYGWVPDLPDCRDLMYNAELRALARLPGSVDLCYLCSRVEDQGQLGSCTGNALAGALEFMERKDKVSFVDFSRLFIYYYYNERLIERTTKADASAMIHDGIKTLVKQGVCPEKAWPHVIKRPCSKESRPITAS
jgi:C1A family cysteine protease